MKKGYYIHWNARHMSGVSKKIDAQMYALKKCFDIKEIELKLKKGYIRNIGIMLPLGSAVYDYKLAEEQMEYCPDFIYIRSGPFDRNSYGFIIGIIHKYPKCIIIVELPNWPRTFWNMFFSIYIVYIIKERLIYEPLFRKHISRYVTYSAYDEIKGISTIKTKNPIIVDEYRCYANKKDDNNIHLLSVSHMDPHHGYERILAGLYNYYKRGGKKSIVLDMVGQGDEMGLYKHLTKKYDLIDNVTFHGEITGKDLEDIYSKADIALGIFGLYKDKCGLSSAIKVREYLAYGLPVISGCSEDFIEKGDECVFYRQYPNDPSPIDIEDVLTFYDGLMQRYEISELRQMIHDYAKRTVDADIVMKPIVDYINGQ